MVSWPGAVNMFRRASRVSLASLYLLLSIGVQGLHEHHAHETGHHRGDLEICCDPLDSHWSNHGDPTTPSGQHDSCPVCHFQLKPPAPQASDLHFSVPPQTILVVARSTFPYVTLALPITGRGPPRV